MTGFPVEETFARTLFGEARGENLIGKVAVANVIVNRAATPKWWGKTIDEVCRSPRQFSCWNKGDINYGVVTTPEIAGMAWEECRVVAELARLKLLRDVTLGATHYASVNVYPPWAEGKEPCVIIGAHKMWNNIE